VQIPRLREWREARALTQVELAAQADISPRSVAGYEAGSGARPPTVRKLAEALEVEIGDLLSEGDHPKGAAQPSVQLTINGVLAEELRRPTDRDIKTLDRWLSYLEKQLDENKLDGEQLNHELDGALASAIMKAHALYPGEIQDQFLRVMRRVLEEAKSFGALEAEKAALVEADMRQLEASGRDKGQ
jgi:transcriptional regulator with XRE-family HTH domain